MSLFNKIKEFVFGSEDEIKNRKEIKTYQRELNKEYKMKIMKAEMERKLEDVKNGKEIKKSGFEAFGASILKAAENSRNHDFIGGNIKKKDYGKDLLK